MTNTKDRNDCWLGMGAAQLVMECQDLCKQRDELLSALEGETDAVKALMSWCVKNVHKWDFPQYDNLCYWISKREGAIASVKEKA